ncbi:hypothetical protein EE612_051964 [Oryza sativa]|nr:hypothetical protein EE612_051964 [Oryza sativa]
MAAAVSTAPRAPLPAGAVSSSCCSSSSSSASMSRRWDPSPNPSSGSGSRLFLAARRGERLRVRRLAGAAPAWHRAAAFRPWCGAAAVEAARGAPTTRTPAAASGGGAGTRCSTTRSRAPCGGGASTSAATGPWRLPGRMLGSGRGLRVVAKSRLGARWRRKRGSGAGRGGSSTSR